MGKKYVLDTSAIISGKSLPLNIEVYVPKSVLKEIHFKKQYYILERSKILNPSKNSVEKVNQAAKETGDIHKLSPVDIDVIALALDKNCVTITDDYAIQNVIKHLGLEFISLNENGIKKEFKWIYRCKGCKRYFDEFYDVCPFCGSELKLVKKKF
ncbi:MAG: DNA-binding protein [Thermoplasmata archaeon]